MSDHKKPGVEDTIQDAKDYLRAKWEKGTPCPACGQRVQLYDYKLYATSARALIELYKLGDGYHHVSDFAEADGDRPRAPHFAELRFWQLITAKSTNENPKKKSSGFWAISERGKAFVKGEITLPSRILIFNNKFQGFSDKSEEITIGNALGNEFDYEDLMGSGQAWRDFLDSTGGEDDE